VMEEESRVQLHMDVVVYHILPQLLAEHRKEKGLGKALARVLICRAARTASHSLAFWLPWYVAPVVGSAFFLSSLSLIGWLRTANVSSERG
jgi:hypothetical protein